MATGKYNTRKYQRERHRPRRSIGKHRACCWRKKRHRSEGAAQKALTAMRHSARYDGQPIIAYECSHCGGWHIGHAAKEEGDLTTNDTKDTKVNDRE